MKKYLLIPVLMLSFNAFAEVTKDDVNAMRKEVKGMTKEEVTAKHVELSKIAIAEPNEKNCDAFEVFDKASLREKKIELMDMDAQKRGYDVSKNCNGLW